MYDRYDTPYGEEPAPSESPLSGVGEQAAPIVDALRANWKIIVGVIALIAVLYFAYDYFVGSYREVSISTVDTEGKNVQASMKVYNDLGNEVAALASGQKARLKVGEYKVSAAALDYKAVTEFPLMVSGNGTQKIELERDKDIRLEGEFPEALITGEKRQLQLTITNNGSKSENVELVLEGGLAKDAKLEENIFTAIQGENSLTVTLSVSGKGSKSGEKKGAIRVKGLRQWAEVSGTYKLVLFDETKFNVTLDGSKTSTNFGSMQPGERKTKKLRLENKTGVDVEGLSFGFATTESELGEGYKVEEWFTTNPQGGIGVSSEENREIIIDFAVPRDIVFQEGINTVKVLGIINVQNSFVEKEFTYEAQIRKPEAKVDLGGIDSIVKVRKKDNAWETINAFLSIRNTGKVRLTDFKVRVKCNSTGVSWLQIINEEQTAGTNVSFDSLEVNSAPKQIPYTVKVPSSTKAKQTVQCSIEVKYEDPNGPNPLFTKQLIISTE